MKISDSALAVLSGALDMGWKIAFAVSIAYQVWVHGYPQACGLFCLYLGMLQKDTK